MHWWTCSANLIILYLKNETKESKFNGRVELILMILSLWYILNLKGWAIIRFDMTNNHNEVKKSPINTKILRNLFKISENNAISLNFKKII
jgi:hypothetical protein